MRGGVGQLVEDVLPAYAGMIPGSPAKGGNVESAPRVCGDDPSMSHNGSNTIRCSPRMRG